MKKQYSSFEEIDRDLKLYQLQREVAMEEAKNIRYQLQHDLSPANWFSTALSAIKKYGILYLIKRIFR